MRLVGAKCSKGALVDLVNWLLADRKVAVAAGEAVANDLRAQLESSQREAAIQAGKLFEDDVELRAAEAHAAAMSAKLQASQQENYAMEARLKDATVEDARGVAMRLTRAEIGVVLSWGGVLTQPEARAGIAPGLLAKLRAIPPQRGQ